MKKEVYTLFILSLPAFIYCQQIKTYNGAFENGQATYQYFENDNFERIFQGSFSYHGTTNIIRHRQEGIKTNSVTLTGFYKNNLKNGLWEGTEDYSIGGYYAKFRTYAKGNFKDGLREGLWSYSLKIDDQGKLRQESGTFQFIKNQLTGKIKLSDIEGSFDEFGDYTGIWKIQREYKEYIAEFVQNTFIKLIIRDVRDGKIIFKYNQKDFNGSWKDSLNQSVTYIKDKPFAMIFTTSLEPNQNSVTETILDENQKKLNSDDNSYFLYFYTIIEGRLGNFDRSVSAYSKGSEDFSVKIPYVIVFFQGSD